MQPLPSESGPYYRPVGAEVEAFQHAHRCHLPLLLKGPTGCGKSRFVEAMASAAGQELVTVACNDETSATDLLGRWIVKGGDTVWQDGPVTRAVRRGAVLYLDEIAEAREDVIVVLHPLSDHRRQLFLDRIDETLTAPPDFMLVVSYNPGYRRGLRELKPSTRQRFVSLRFDYPPEDAEIEIVRTEARVPGPIAKKLVTLARKIRKLEELGLGETVSTRQLVSAGALIHEGLPPRVACNVAIVQPLTDDGDVSRAIQDIADLVFFVSWDEKLFGLFHRALRAGRRKLDERSPEELARTVSLSEPRARLRLFASAIAGMPVEVLEAEHGGGTRGTLILLPAEISFAPSFELNASAALLRTAYAAMSVRLGFEWSGQPELRSLATLLAVPATLAALEDELPRTRDLRLELLPAVLATRPAIGALAATTQYLEVLAQALLGRPIDELAAEAPAAATWASEVQRAPDTTPQTLMDRVSRLGAGRPFADISPIVLWGSLHPTPRGKDGAPVKPGELGAAGVRTERKARAREGVKTVELKKRDSEAENPVVHSFEKLHTAEEHKGGDKRADGADELDDHAEALDELEIREVARSQEQAKSLYRADVVLDDASGVGAAEGADAAGILYDEWEEKTRTYREGWCRLRADVAPDPADRGAAVRQARTVRARHRRTTEALRGELEQLDCSRRWHNRQSDGPEVDIDALVDRHATLKSGRGGPERLYVFRRRHEQDVAVLVLLDASLSTDAWVDGRRVIDVARESILVLGSVLRDVDVDTAIGAFFSNTRRDCRYTTVKDFDDDWPTADGRLMGIEPTGYTRIGPALRHGTTLLDRRDARRKLLLLISDGKPSDYDRYEGKYGVADVRQAIREATRLGIATFGLAIDAEARFHLPQMFGPGGYDVLPRPEALVRTMARVYRDLLR